MMLGIMSTMTTELKASQKERRISILAKTDTIGVNFSIVVQAKLKAII